MMTSGEDERLVIEDWLKGNETPETMIVVSIFGDLPRPDFTTRDSLLAVLPNVKSFLEQQDADVAEWRELAAAAGIDYDAVEAIRPVSGEVYAS